MTKKIQENVKDVNKELEQANKELEKIFKNSKAIDQVHQEMYEHNMDGLKIVGKTGGVLLLDLIKKIPFLGTIAGLVYDLSEHSAKAMPYMERLYQKLLDISELERRYTETKITAGNVILANAEQEIIHNKERRTLLREINAIGEDELGVEIESAEIRRDAYMKASFLYKQEREDLEVNRDLYSKLAEARRSIVNQSKNGASDPIYFELGGVKMQLERDEKIIEKALKNIDSQMASLSNKMSVGQLADSYEDKSKQYNQEAIDKSRKSATEKQQETKNDKARLEEEQRLVEEYGERIYKAQVRNFEMEKHEAELKNEKVKGLEAVEAVQIKSIDSQAVLAQNNEKINKQVAESEADSQKTRLEQWKDYAEKAAEISRKISEATGMVTSSLGGMFGQLGSYYAEQVQAFADKIAVLDEEKEAALERVALSEEERQAKEEEIAIQKVELEYATSDEQRAKADERIATLQGELSAEDTINREFGDKKAELEKEKAKKEAEQKKAEKMEKRLQMSQAIVEAIGDVAAGAAKALKYGPILGPIMAAIVSAAGAVQVGIMTKQLTKMKDGGLLRGLSHAQGGMRIMGSNVEVEGGEYVVNKQSTSKNLGLLEYINGERRGLGYMDMNTYFGEQSVPPSFLTQMMNEPSVVPQLPMKDSVDTQILNAIERINFQPRVSVTDINTVHDNMVKVDEWTGL